MNFCADLFKALKCALSRNTDSRRSTHGAIWCLRCELPGGWVLAIKKRGQLQNHFPGSEKLDLQAKVQLPSRPSAVPNSSLSARTVPSSTHLGGRDAGHLAKRNRSSARPGWPREGSALLRTVGMTDRARPSPRDGPTPPRLAEGWGSLTVVDAGKEQGDSVRLATSGT